MSEGNQNMKEDENDSLSDSDDPLIEIADTDNASQESDSTQSVNSEESLYSFVASGIDVQISDIIMIENISDEIHARSSDELSTSPHECQINPDDENVGQLACPYFDNSILCEKDLQQLEAFYQSSGSNASSLNTSIKREEMNSGGIEGGIDTGNKNKMEEISQEEISSTGKQKAESQVIKNPCTKIFKFMHPKLDNLREKSFLQNNKNDFLKCPDYESDEFADVEDNARDSSDNNDLSDKERQMKGDKNFFPEVIEIDEQASKSVEKTTTNFPDGSEVDLLDDENVTSANRTQVYNAGPSCSHTFNPKRIPDFINPAKSEEIKAKFKIPTIADVLEVNNKIPKGKSSSHKSNPLKMKTKVGMRKDKCNVCRARLGLCAIKCRCGGYYCAKHRYDKEHNCTFDYKSMGAEEIRKNNPRVVAEKVRKL